MLISGLQLTDKKRTFTYAGDNALTTTVRNKYFGLHLVQVQQLSDYVIGVQCKSIVMYYCSCFVMCCYSTIMNPVSIDNITLQITNYDTVNTKKVNKVFC